MNLLFVCIGTDIDNANHENPIEGEDAERAVERTGLVYLAPMLRGLKQKPEY